ncbi:exopolysaccharide biosynthesis protein [Orrella sp. JC864]|uniref:exopolysaccharide biosynthesis protein n=1 Tax=Orrella sp. JC864 TaxID=3120298 RepID=UPI00300A3A4D
MTARQELEQERQAHQHDLADMLDALSELGQAHRHVSVGDIRESVGERSVGPFLTIPALLEISPLGAVPGVPTAIALVLAIFSAQILCGRKHLWLPGFIEHRAVQGQKLARGMRKIRPAADWIDRYIQPRWMELTRKPFRMAIGAICLALCLTVPFLELVPFASSAPMAAIALFGLGLTSRDGVLVSVGLALSAGAGYLLLASLGKG